MTGIRVNTEDYAAAAGPVASASSTVDHTMTTLMGKLAEGAHVGTDPISAPLAHALDKASGPAVKSGCALTGRLSALANAIRTSAHNHAQADSRAALTPVKAPTAAKSEKLSTAVKAPPSSLAGGGTDPAGWENVAPYVQRHWPNGLTGNMHSTAAAYKAAAKTLADIHKDTGNTAKQLGDQSSPEITTACSKATTIGQDASNTANELLRLGSALEVYANYLDDNRNDVETLLRNAVTTLQQSQSNGDGYSASSSAASGTPTQSQIEDYWRQIAKQADSVTSAIQREAHQLAGDLSSTDSTKLQSEIDDINASATSTTHHPIKNFAWQDDLKSLTKIDGSMTGLMSQASYMSTLGGTGPLGYFKGDNVKAWQAGLDATAAGTKDGVGFTEVTGIGAKALNFKLASSAIPQTTMLGKAAAKAGPLGAVGLVSGAVSMGNDFRGQKWGKFADDTVSEGLAAGAVFAPPPADVICGAGALADSVYHIPAVRDFVNNSASNIAHGTVDAAKSAGKTIASGWHSLTSGW